MNYMYIAEDVSFTDRYGSFIFYFIQAAKDAQRWMGNRTFYDQMLVDACQHQQLKITDEVDVTTMQEYMQACKNIHSILSCHIKPSSFLYMHTVCSNS